MLEKWNCSACQNILGTVEDKRIVRIKRKDYCVEAEGGKITVNCYKCGKSNTIIDDKMQTGEEVNINGL